jgi:hypothetical protein
MSDRLQDDVVTQQVKEEASIVFLEFCLRSLVKRTSISLRPLALSSRAGRGARLERTCRSVGRSVSLTAGPDLVSGLT